MKNGANYGIVNSELKVKLLLQQPISLYLEHSGFSKTLKKFLSEAINRGIVLLRCCLSLVSIMPTMGCDSVSVLRGRTPFQVYADYTRSFRDRFSDYLGSVISEIQVGMGLSRELRYPSYPESNGTWKFPGIGEFQCYDKYIKASLAAAAEAIGKKEWGKGGPHDSGQYKQFPEDTSFFRKYGTWNSEYGQFFWGALLAACKNHGHVELAELDVKHLLELEPDSSGKCLLLSSLYAEAGK